MFLNVAVQFDHLVLNARFELPRFGLQSQVESLKSLELDRYIDFFIEVFLSLRIRLLISDVCFSHLRETGFVDRVLRLFLSF